MYDMSIQLLLLLTLSATAEHLPVGKEFLAVFPENIAYYFPSSSLNKIRLTGLFNDTAVTLHPSDSSESTHQLRSGQMQEVNIEPEQELNKAEKSNKTVYISSNHNITVEVLSYRNNSIQTSLLFPMEHLGTDYIIPPIPQIDQTTSSGSGQDPERTPFKLIITNGNQNNNITVKNNIHSLAPREVLQIWISNDMVGTSVTGTEAFQVLFHHSCATMFSCTCGVLYTPLLPRQSTKSQFIVPKVFNDDASGKTYLLNPSTNARQEFREGKWEASGYLVLQRPGLLMNMIPEAEFGSCFSIQAVVNAQDNFAIVVATAATEDLMIGNQKHETSWTDISGTEYKFVKVQLQADKKTIMWIKFGKMAVYFVGKIYDNQNAWFGNPAARISINADYRGCVVKPDKLEVLQEKVSWKKSIQACKSHNLTLIGLSDQNFQKQIYSRILDMNLGESDFWMGMRKNSYNASWYWVNQDLLGHMDWSNGFPRSDNDGRCAQIDLKDSKNPGWINKQCCALARPVCYDDPELLNLA